MAERETGTVKWFNEKASASSNERMVQTFSSTTAPSLVRDFDPSLKDRLWSFRSSRAKKAPQLKMSRPPHPAQLSLSK